MREPSKCSRYLSLAALTATAASFAFVADTFAQGMMMRGPNAGIMRGPSTNMNPGRIGGGSIANTGPRTPGSTARIPGGAGPRIPGGPGVVVTIPSGGGGGGGGPPHVYVDDDDDHPRRRPPKKNTPQQQQQKQQQASSNRPGFNLPPSGERNLVPNEVLVTTPAALPNDVFQAILRRHRLTQIETQDFQLTGRRIHRLRINGNRSVSQVINALRSETQLNRAGANFQYALLQANALNAGDGAGEQYALAKLRLNEAHAIARGQSVVVAVIDSMIDADHPELKGMIVDRFNATGAEDKPHAHGTGMAGAIASQGRVTGTAPAVRVLAAKAFGVASKDGQGTTFHILKSIEWAAKNGARVINMSFAGPTNDPEIADMLAAARTKKIVLIAAAGNAGPKSPPLFPAADPNVIAVTATDNQDRGFERAVRGKHIAVSAPGVDILVPSTDSGYQLTSGTSVAAAEISGVAALLVERGPTLDADNVRKLLMSSARDLGPKGHDVQFGAGLTDAYQALMLLPPPPAAPVATK